MTVASTARKQQFTLDAVETEFTFTFRALTSAPTDIKCKVTDGDGVDSDLTYTTDYTVAVNSDGVGGTVTLVDAAATGSGTLTVYRETTNKQESDYTDYGAFPADTLEKDIDIRTLVAQEQSEKFDRTLLLPISYSGTATTILPTPVANKVIGWNSAANALENKTFTASTDFELAAQADAEAGTNNTKYMSPLRVKQWTDTLMDTTTGHDHDGTDSKTVPEAGVVFSGSGHNHTGGTQGTLIASLEDLIINGWETGDLTNNMTVCTVSPGLAYHGSTKIRTTSSTTLTFGTAADWFDGSQESYAGGIGWCYVGYDSSGNIKLLGSNGPDVDDTSGNTGGTPLYFDDTGGSSGEYWRIINCFRMDTDNAVDARGVLQRGGWCVIDFTANLSTSNSTNAWSSAVSCAAYVPPISRLALFGIHFVMNASDAESGVAIKANGTTGSAGLPNQVYHSGCGNGLRLSGELVSATDSSQQISHYDDSPSGLNGAPQIIVKAYKLNIR